MRLVQLGQVTRQGSQMISGPPKCTVGRDAVQLRPAIPSRQPSPWIDVRHVGFQGGDCKHGYSFSTAPVGAVVKRRWDGAEMRH